MSLQCIKRPILACIGLLLICGSFQSFCYQRDSAETAAKEQKAIDDFSKRMDISYEEARISMIMATTDLVEHNCRLDPGDLYKEFREKMLKDPKILRAHKEYYSYIDSICVYSRENWCADFGGGNKIFGIW